MLCYHARQTSTTGYLTAVLLARIDSSSPLPRIQEPFFGLALSGFLLGTNWVWFLAGQVLLLHVYMEHILLR